MRHLSSWSGSGWNRLVLGMTAVVLMALATGCESMRPGGGGASLTGDDVESADRLNVGDRVRVMITDIPSPPPVIEQLIPESGKLLLHLNQEFQFAGRRRNELEREIQKHYIDKQYYHRIVVNIEVMPRPVTVGGEVRSPGVLQYHGQMTVTKAIDGAGGFTEYAAKRRVRITRLNGQQLTVNCVRALRNPSSDLRIYPGDKVHVDRSIW